MEVSPKITGMWRTHAVGITFTNALAMAASMPEPVMMPVKAPAAKRILAIISAELLTAVLAGFCRTVSEVGAVILVGGNIRGLTRTMTTTIALQTSQGDQSLALALGAVLVGVSISISATVFALAGRARTAGSDEA